MKLETVTNKADKFSKLIKLRIVGPKNDNLLNFDSHVIAAIDEFRTTFSLFLLQFFEVFYK